MMGWTDGTGLGKGGQGLVAPVSSLISIKAERDKRGLGQLSSLRSIARAKSKRVAAATSAAATGKKDAATSETTLGVAI